MKLPNGENITVSYGVIDESGGLMTRLRERIARDDFRWAESALSSPPPKEPGRVSETPISEHEDGDVSGERTGPAEHSGIVQREDER